MSGIASATGLLEARIRPVCRPQPKHVELSGSTKPAPFILRPFSGFFNPYSYGCSVLCNHPADCEAKEILQRAKDSWVTEGKALLLSKGVDMIKTNLIVANSVINMDGNTEITNNTATVSEKLFRKYTDPDSRPLSPTFTIASGSVSTIKRTHREFPLSCSLRERTTLVLDLRTNSQKQMENETFTWHALTLELPPIHRKTEIFMSKPVLRCTSEHQIRSRNSVVAISNMFPSVDTYDESNFSKDTEENKLKVPSKEPTVSYRRGKRLRKGKCRRGSAYGQQTEVHDLFEPTETQISHIADGSRRTSTCTNNENEEDLLTSPPKASAISNAPSTIPPSFIEPDILKHLCRELDIDKVEAEFSIRKKVAFEEALRIKGENYSYSKRSQIFSKPVLVDTPRVFSRQAARFEILGSENLRELTVLEYLSKHVFVSSGRKLIFSRVFNKFQEDAIRRTRFISPNDIHEALQNVIGKPLSEEQGEYLKLMIGEIKNPLNFRTWCGLCAAVERLLCSFPSKDVDPATWLERVDFESLERRLESTTANSELARFLREISNK